MFVFCQQTFVFCEQIFVFCQQMFVFCQYPDNCYHSCTAVQIVQEMTSAPHQPPPLLLSAPQLSLPWMSCFSHHCRRRLRCCHCHSCHHYPLCHQWVQTPLSLLPPPPTAVPVPSTTATASLSAAVQCLSVFTTHRQCFRPTAASIFFAATPIPLFSTF